jgi:hypothetical protein
LDEWIWFAGSVMRSIGLLEGQDLPPSTIVAIAASFPACSPNTPSTTPVSSFRLPQSNKEKKGKKTPISAEIAVIEALFLLREKKFLSVLVNCPVVAYFLSANCRIYA